MTLFAHHKLQTKNQALPTLVEFAVHPSLAPYLVSTSKGYLWVDRASKAGQVRAQPVSWGDEKASLEAISMILERAQSEDWGAVFPATPEGLEEISPAMRFFHPSEVQVFRGSNTPDLLSGIPQVSWVPEGVLIFVPKHRRWLATAYDIQGQSAYVVDNATAGIAFLTTGRLVR
jgi:hypothetical protein